MNADEDTPPGRAGADAAEEADGADGAGTGESSDRTELTVAFGDDGLVPAVAQDAESGDVLMLAYVSPEALARTEETGRAHYYSRSRDELWEKGATSGHVQHVREIRVDCDADALLYVVDQEGGACHTGRRSCFYRTVEAVEDGDGHGGEGDGEDGDGAGGDRGAGSSAGGLGVEVVADGERVFDPDDVY